MGHLANGKWPSSFILEPKLTRMVQQITSFHATTQPVSSLTLTWLPMQTPRRSFRCTGSWQQPRCTLSLEVGGRETEISRDNRSGKAPLCKPVYVANMNQSRLSAAESPPQRTGCAGNLRWQTRGWWFYDEVQYIARQRTCICCHWGQHMYHLSGRNPHQSMKYLQITLFHVRVSAPANLCVSPKG